MVTYTRQSASAAVREAGRPPEPSAGRDPRVSQVERWFVRQGLPTLRLDDGRRDTLARMAPVLAFVGVTGLLERPLQNMVIVLYCVAAAGAFALRYWIGVTRRSVAVRWTRFASVCLYWASAIGMVEFSGPEVTVSAVGSVVILGTFFPVAYLATAYGLVPLAGRALLHVVRDVRDSVQLQARSLPLLLFLTLFFFFTGELWQLADRLSWWRESVVIGIFATVTVCASAARLREEIQQIEQRLSIPEMLSACRGTPLEGALDECAAAVPLTRRQSFNLLLLLAGRQLTQAAVVGVGMFLFFVSIGLVLIDPATMQQWIGSPPNPSNLIPVLPVALLRVSLLLAGFASMYFAISTMTDPHYRKEFFPPVIRELERALAVRAAYLTLMGRGGRSATGHARQAGS